MRWKPLLNVVLTILVLGGAGLAVWKAYEASRPETRAEQVARLQREITAQRALEDQARAEARAQPETPANPRAMVAAPPPAAGLPTLGTFYSPSRQPQVVYQDQGNQPTSQREGATIPPVRRLQGQKGLVHAIKVAPGGKTFASAGSDGTVKIWDIASGKLLQTISGTTNIVRTMDWSSDGKRIAVGLQGGMIQVLDVPGRKVLDAWQAHDIGVDGIRFLPGDQQLISTGCDGSVRTWKTDGAALLNQGVHSSCVGGLDLFPDGRHALTASFDGSAAIFDTQTGSTEALVGLQTGALCASVIDHGKQALIYQQSGDALIFDVASKKIVATLREQTGGDVCATNADQTLAVETRGHGADLWSLASRQHLAALTGPGGIMWGMDMSPDGRWVIAGGGYDPRDPNTQAGSDDTIYIWDLAAGALPAAPLPGGIQTLAMAPGGTRGVYASSDGSVHAIAATPAGLSVSQDLPAKADPALLAISSDATQAAAATGSTLKLLDLSGKDLGSWTLPANATAVCAMGRGVAAAATGKDIYACYPGQQPKLLTHRPSPVDALASVGDGNRLLFAAGNEVDLFAITATHPGIQFSFGVPARGRTLAIAASPDGRNAYLLHSAIGFCLYDLSDGRFLYQFAPPFSHYTTMLPGPDDHTVLLGGAGCALLDFSAPAVLARLQGPMGPPIAAAFTAPGEVLFIGAGGDARNEHFVRPALVPLDGDARAAVVAPQGPGSGIGAQFRSNAGKNNLVLYDLGTGQALRQIPISTPIAFEQHLTISSDGALVAFPTSAGVTIVDTHDGHLENIASPSTPVRAIGFSPDHRTLATTGPQAHGIVTLSDIATGQQKLLIQGVDTQIGELVFSPDGSRLVEVSRIRDLSHDKHPQQGLWLFDTATGATFRSLPLIGRDPVNVAYSPDGALLYVMDDVGGLQCFDGKTMAVKWLANFGPTHLSRAALSPSGDRLFFWGGAITAVDTATHAIAERYGPAANPLMSLFFVQGQPMVFSATDDDNLHHSVGAIQKLSDLGTTP